MSEIKIDSIGLMNDRPWAIHPAKLEEINTFIAARSRGELLQALDGKSGSKADESYEVKDGVAVIRMYGVLSKRMNLMQAFSGGTSAELLGRDLNLALSDPDVKGILLDIDSPGGTVDGTGELADIVSAARGIKPVVAYASGVMASAAYWIGSAADFIVAYNTCLVGSIGVALTHFDRSAADEKEGVKRTIISAGKYKRIASDEKPLSKEGKEYLQEMVDATYSIFVDTVAQNRGVSVETVLKDMADGRDFMGKDALAAGLVDHIGTFDDAFRMAKGETITGQLIKPKEGKKMDINTFKADHPEVYNQVFEQGAASVDAGQIAADAEDKGMQAERKRVTDILAADADMEVTRKAITEGTSADGAFKLFYEAEKGRKAAGLKELQTDATPPQGNDVPAVESSLPADQEVSKRAVALTKEKNIDIAEATRQVLDEDKDLAARYEKSFTS